MPDYRAGDTVAFIHDRYVYRGVIDRWAHIVEPSRAIVRVRKEYELPDSVVYRRCEHHDEVPLWPEQILGIPVAEFQI